MQVTLLASLAPHQAPVCAKYPDMPGSGVTGPAHLEFLSTVGLERGPFEVQGPRELGVPSSTQHPLPSCALYDLTLELTDRNQSLLSARIGASCFHIWDLILIP